MRFLAVLGKFLRESLREWGILALALGFAPFFVLVFHFAYSGSQPLLSLAVVDEDRPAVSTEVPPKEASSDFGRAVIASLRASDTASGPFRMRILEVDRRREAEAFLLGASIDLALVIPPGFSDDLVSGRPPSLEFLGDPASPKYTMILALAYAAVEPLIAAATGRSALFDLVETSIRPEGKADPFDAAVPSLLILSILTVMFTAASLFVREAENGTLTRLRLSRLGALEYLGAASLAQLAISLTCVAFALLTAMAFGYRLESSVFGIFLVCSLSAASVIAFGLVTAGLCSSVKDVMIVGNFPYFFMLLFSGVMPIPLPTLFHFAGRAIGPEGIIPMSFGVRALEGLMNYGRGVGEVGFEIAAMAALTAIWFVAGLLLFARRHLRAA